MAGNWRTTGVRGEGANDRVFVENAETKQTGSVCTTPTSDQGLRDQQVGAAISQGRIENLTPPSK